MRQGLLFNDVDVAQVVLYIFFIFFAGLILYLRREDKREGYPLESERSEYVTVQGFPGIPAPKTFLLANGATQTAPRRELDDRPLRAIPVAPWPGAPLEPTGNPMIDGVGPASYALRANVPDTTYEGHARIVPLRVARTHTIETRDPDPRGMDVVGADGLVAGTVSDAWVDRAEGLIWGLPHDVRELESLLDANPDIGWVQLPFAGVENFIDLVDDERTWTCGKGVYAEPVAELALALALAGMRGVGNYSRQRTWTPPRGTNLHGASVTILGGGGITESLIRLLVPFGCRITVVRNRVQEMEGVDEVLEADRYIDALAGADLVVVALALTDETEGMLSRSEFEIMENHAWIVNVARGRHIVTDDLVWALQAGQVGGAGLDVTDPEPLPDNHPLWSVENCIITPHVGNTPEMGDPLLAARIEENVRRSGQGRELVGGIDPELGY